MRVAVVDGHSQVALRAGWLAVELVRNIAEGLRDRLRWDVARLPFSAAGFPEVVSAQRLPDAASKSLVGVARSGAISDGRSSHPNERSARLTIPGAPVPVARRTRGDTVRHYLPQDSRSYLETVEAEWSAAGRPCLGDVPFAASMRFYGASATADLDSLVKVILVALNGLAFADDCQLVCLSGCHKLPVDADGARAVIDLWPAVAVSA
jgi:hypothetical protein